MKEGEWFDKIHASLNNIVNSSFNLGEKYSKPKIVRKFLRSLVKSFRSKSLP